jgi:hypothetical protein
MCELGWQFKDSRDLRYRTRRQSSRFRFGGECPNVCCYPLRALRLDLDYQFLAEAHTPSLQGSPSSLHTNRRLPDPQGLPLGVLRLIGRTGRPAMSADWGVRRETIFQNQKHLEIDRYFSQLS